MLEHHDILEKIVRKRRSAGMNDYLFVLRSLKGADPREVWEAFKKCHPQAEKEKHQKIGIFNSYQGFPECHPAYSQWRLTEFSADAVLHNIENKNYSSIAFLGCPALASSFRANGEKNLVLDLDTSCLDLLKKHKRDVLEYDVNNELPNELRGKFDCAISDPPWYYEDIQRFVARSSELVKEGGTIYFSIPGLLTKPSIIKERLDFQKWLSKSSLVLENMSPLVEYEVPAFEYMAYSDIPAFTGDFWRTGDWVKLKKIENKKIDIEKSQDKTKWLEYSINNKRIFLMEKDDDGREAKLSALYPDGTLVLNTVSKRNPLVEKVDVWSSRNAVLHIEEGYSHVKEILEDISRDYNAYYGSRCPNCELLKMLVEV